MRLNFLFVSLLLSSSLFSQNCIQKTINEYDAILLSHENIKDLSIKKISFIEAIDTGCFPKHLLPPASVKFILHTVNFNLQGLPEHYEWSYNESDKIILNEKESSYGRFYILNEYDMTYSDNKISSISISDASLNNYINYQYTADSIISEKGIFNSDKTIYKKRYSYKTEFCNITYKHTGTIAVYFPWIQVIPLNELKTEEIYINDIPANSFLTGKFEKNRFLIEIRPGLYIFFEISV